MTRDAVARIDYFNIVCNTLSRRERFGSLKREMKESKANRGTGDC